MARVLLVDTNFSSGPIYKRLLGFGHDVFIVGGNPNDSLAKATPAYIELDYSDVSALERLADRLRVDFLVPGCNDRSYEVCSAIGSNKGFPGLDSPAVTGILSNKRRFREFAHGAGLSVPETYPDASVPRRVPVIVKPVDAFSGKGIVILDNPTRSSLDDAIRVARNASNSGECIVERLVSGQLYSHSGFIRDGKLARDFIVEEHGSANPLVVDTSFVVFEFRREILDQVRAQVQQIIDSLNLTDGLIHTQFMVDDGQLYLIESTRRCPGDLYSQLVELTTGFPYTAAYASSFVQEPWPESADSDRRAFVMRHTMSLPERALLAHVRFSRGLRIERLVPLALTGDTILPSPHSRIGILFAMCDSKIELHELVTQALQRKLYSVH